MNKKIIKKIMAKARRQSAEIYPPGSGAYESLVFEKFAEFIVRECSQISHNSHPDELPFVGGKILEHFGVKE